ncbi:MAG: alpha/beta hydrolase, partial [Gemmatimonadetes bacterium]|nr:alpha/beta hydrolase [Gemmatimonadota bacterium]
MLSSGLVLFAFWAVVPTTPQLHGQERFSGATTIGVVDSVWSPTLEEHRPYLVYTPPSYSDTTLTPQTYPVVYVLDGDAHFHSLSGLIHILSTGVNGTYVLPEMIVVAVPNTDRTRDLTPTHDTTGLDGSPVPGFRSSGGNPQFFQFLENELIPRVEADYRTSSYRTLIGHSFGGITVINALYTMPQAFTSFISIDPSLWWDDEVLLRRARDYFSQSDLRGKSLYVAQANTVQPDDTIPNGHFSAISRFNEVVKAYDRSGMRYDFQYYPDDDHGSVPLISEYDGLRFAFDGYRVPLGRAFADPSVLDGHFQRVSDRLGHQFGPSEGMLRLLGQFTLQSDTAAALSFAEMRVERFPDSWSAHEFLGDV